MNQQHPNFFSEEVMSSLAKIETSFQDVEKFLQTLKQEGCGQNFAELLQHVQKAKSYVANLRQKLPNQWDEEENKIIEALEKSAEKNPN